MIRKRMCLHINGIARGGSYLWGRESEYNFGITVQMYALFSSQLEATRTSFPLKRRKRRRLFTTTIPPILQSIPHLTSATFFNSFLLFDRYTVKARGMENACVITYGKAFNRVVCKKFSRLSFNSFSLLSIVTTTQNVYHNLKPRTRVL